MKSVNKLPAVEGINSPLAILFACFVLFRRSFSFLLFNAKRTITSVRQSVRECVYLITDVYIVIYFIEILRLFLYMWILYYVYSILCWIFIGERERE